MTEEEELEQLMKEALEERDEIQSEEESGENEAENTDEGEAEEEETESTEEEKDEDSEDEDDEQTSGTEDDNEDDGDDSTDESSFTPIEVEVAGVPVTITSQEELMAYVKKGASTFNAEPDTLKEEKKVIEQGQLSAEDLKILVDAKNGSKEAIAKLAQIGKVDVVEIEEDDATNYTQQKEYKEESDVDKVAGEILADEDHAQLFKNTIKSLPQDFIQQITSDANLLKHFSEHLRTGLAQEAIPKAMNEVIVNGGSFFDHYAKIGQKIYAEKNTPEQKKEERVVTEKEKQLRKRASSSNGTDSSRKTINADDVWELSDEEFAEYQASLKQ
jgi:hypothetical protein